MLRISRSTAALLLFGIAGTSCVADRVTPPTASFVEVMASPATVLADACPDGATRWAAPVNGNWLDATRWTAGVPGASVPACVDLPGTYIVTAGTGATVTAQSLFLGVPGGSLQPVLRISWGTLSVGTDATLHGRVELNPGSSRSAALVAGGTLGIAATGVLTTGDNGTKTAEGVTVQNEGAIVVGPQAASVNRLTLRAATLVNRGTISVPTGGRDLDVLGPTSGGDPAVRLEAGAVEAFNAFSIEQTRGTLTVSDGSVTGTLRLIALTELRVEGGTGGTFQLWRLGGLVPPTTTRLRGTIGESQQVWIGNNNITVDASDVVNHGLITVNSDGATGVTSSVLRASSGSTLHNGATATIAYAGNGGPVLSGAIENDGLITTAAGPNGTLGNMHLRPYPLVNRGTVRVVGTSTLQVVPPAGEPAAHVINDGGRFELTSTYNQVGGRFEHRDGSVTGTGASSFTGVQWSGYGVWGRSLTLAGASTVDPGASPGRIAVSTDYVPSATTVTRIELAGDAAGTGYDQIAVAGTARFAGSLSVSLFDDFVPHPCQTFEIMTFAARVGTFANAGAAIDVGGGMKLRQVYSATSLKLVAFRGDGSNVYPTELTVAVGGAAATYDVCAGMGSDIVNILHDDQLVVDKATLTFAASQLPQTVTVSAAPTATRSLSIIQHTGAYPMEFVRVTITGAVAPDVTPPITSAVPSPGANAFGWNSAPVAVALSATDAGSGVSHIQWSLSGAQSGSGVLGASGVVTVMAEGITTLTFAAGDNAGNVEAPQSVTIRIDYTAPTVSVVRAPLPNADGWNFTDVTATFTATDALSGIDGNETVEVVFSEHGANQSATRTFRDRAGNEASATIGGISIDKSPATIACVATPGEIWPVNGRLVPVSIAVSVTSATGFVLHNMASNEPEADDIVDFVVGTADTQGRLRAARRGGGAGRVYTFEYRTVGGLTPAAATCEVRVPHDQGRGK